MIGGTVAAPRPPAPVPSQNVYLLRTRHTINPTWFAVHPTSMLTGLSSTMLVVFTDGANAESWARGLTRCRAHHGAYPTREYTKLPRKFVWASEEDSDDCDEFHQPTPVSGTLDVVQMRFGDVLGFIKGSGMHMRVVVDPQNTTMDVDVKQGFDRAAVCERLQANLDASDLRRPPPPTDA